MADLSDLNSAQTVKIAGANTSGTETNFVDSTSAGAIHTNLRDANGNELLGTKISALSIPVVVSQDPTYGASAVAFVSAASATDVFTITGSASKTIRVHKIKVSGTTTSGSAIKFTASLVKRSTANTGGTSVTATIAPYDSTQAAATAVVRHYTANPSALGTSVGVLRAESLAVTASGLTGGVIEWDLRESGQSVVLRGTTELLCVNFNAATITGPVFSISIEWSET